MPCHTSLPGTGLSCTAATYNGGAQQSLPHHGLLGQGGAVHLHQRLPSSYRATDASLAAGHCCSPLLPA